MNCLTHYNHIKIRSQKLKYLIFFLSQSNLSMDDMQEHVHNKLCQRSQGISRGGLGILQKQERDLRQDIRDTLWVCGNSFGKRSLHVSISEIKQSHSQIH